MPCINSDGSLTKTAEKIMTALQTASKDTEIATQVEFPVYLVRSSLRQLVEIGFVRDIDGQYELTELGRDRL